MKMAWGPVQCWLSVDCPRPAGPHSRAMLGFYAPKPRILSCEAITITGMSRFLHHCPFFSVAKISSFQGNTHIGLFQPSVHFHCFLWSLKQSWQSMEEMQLPQSLPKREWIEQNCGEVGGVRGEVVACVCHLVVGSGLNRRVAGLI